MLTNLFMNCGWRIRKFFEDEDGIGVVEVIRGRLMQNVRMKKKLIQPYIARDIGCAYDL